MAEIFLFERNAAQAMDLDLAARMNEPSFSRLYGRERKHGKESDYHTYTLSAGGNSRSRSQAPYIYGRGSMMREGARATRRTERNPALKSALLCSVNAMARPLHIVTHHSRAELPCPGSTIHLTSTQLFRRTTTTLNDPNEKKLQNSPTSQPIVQCL